MIQIDCLHRVFLSQQFFQRILEAFGIIIIIHDKAALLLSKPLLQPEILHDLPADLHHLQFLCLLESFRQAFAMGDWFQYFKNSLFITAVTVVGSLIFNSMAGYAFARLKFKGREFLFMSVLLGMMVSPQSIIIPQYVMMRSAPLFGGNNILGQGGTGLLDTYGSLIVPFLAGAFGIFLCRQFYSTFPTSLDDAARIDGCGVIKTYFVIYLPLSKTILATLTILKSVATWNDFFYPLIMTQSEKMKTVQLGLQMFRGSSMTHYNYLMAATIITVIPMVIVYACAQKYFVQGIVSSGMKN